MKDVFVIIYEWDNNETYASGYWDSTDIVGVFETFEDAQNAFDDILKQRQEYIDKVNSNKPEEDDSDLKIINIVRKPGFMAFGVENDEYCSSQSNNTYKINKFTLGEIEKFGEAYEKEEENDSNEKYGNKECDKKIAELTKGKTDES